VTDEPALVRADLPPPSRMLKGKTVYRVVWKLHTDVLIGYCWCGEPHESIDPIELWDWLLAHPGTHSSDDPAGAPTDDPTRELVNA